MALSSNSVPTAMPGVPVGPAVKPNTPMALPPGSPTPVLAVPAALIWFVTNVSWAPLGAIRVRFKFATLCWSVRATLTVKLSIALGLGTLTEALNDVVTGVVGVVARPGLMSPGGTIEPK